MRKTELLEIEEITNYKFDDYEILSATQYSADYIGDKSSEKHFEFTFALTTIDEVTAKETVSDVELVRTKELKVSEIYG